MSKRKTARKSRDLPHIGWREWLALPDLGIDAIKVKIDTGARTSSLHALHVEPFERGGAEWVRFQVHPMQRDAKTTIQAEAELLEYRRITSSTGHTALRPVVLTTARLLDTLWQIEVTLAGRDAMGFRMLLGREAVRSRFLIDPGRSYVGGRPASVKKRKKRSRR